MLKFLFYCIAGLPNSIAQLLGVFVGNGLYILGGREKHVAATNISLCFPELSAVEQRHLVRQTLIENAKTLCEIPRIFNKGGEYAISLVTATQGMDYYKKAVAANKGVILLGPHLGNWELIGHYLNQFGAMTIMYAPPKQQFLDAIMRKARQSTGVTLVPADTSGVRAQLKSLKQKGVVGILPDQQPKDNHAKVFAPFMGYDAATMLLVNNLAQRTGAIVVYAFAERNAIGKGYTVKIVPASEGVASRDELVAATQLNAGVEQCVRHAPAQYQWTYKRFRIQPQGKASPYD